MKDYFTEEQKKKIIYLYTQENRGQKYCAKAVGSTSVAKVKQVLHEAGIKVRNFSEAAAESNQNRAKHKKEDYFEIQSPSMAWLLGFLASDGCISSSSNQIKIALATKDKEILEKIKLDVQIENDIQDRTTKEGFAVSELIWASQRHKQALSLYGITPRKTFTLQPPTALDPKYYIDFIRGYFDGDGSINYITQGALRWQVCAASKEILQWMIDVLYEQYNIPKVTIYQDTKRPTPFYYFQYSTSSTKKIYDILYTANALRLQRKYDTYTALIKMK